jgi:hypothetical protein
MSQRSEYKVISGKPNDMDKLLAPLAAQGWKPILMSSSSVGLGDRPSPVGGLPVHAGDVLTVTILLEHVAGS